MLSSWNTELVQPIQDTFFEWVKFLPNIFYAFLIIIFGLLVAKSFRLMSIRLGRRLISHSQTTANQNTLSLEHLNSLHTLPQVIGNVGFLLVNLFFLAAALQALGLNVLPMLASQLGAMIPHIFIALVIFTLTFVFSKIIKELMLNVTTLAHMENIQTLVILAQIALWSIALLIIVDQLGVRSTALLMLFAILCAALFSAFAISFGLGARAIAANILSIQYAQKNFKIGDTIVIDGQQGVIVDITTTTVIINTEAGMAHIPGVRFTENSVLVTTH